MRMPFCSRAKGRKNEMAQRRIVSEPNFSRADDYRNEKSGLTYNQQTYIQNLHECQLWNVVGRQVARVRKLEGEMFHFKVL